MEALVMFCTVFGTVRGWPVYHDFDILNLRMNSHFLKSGHTPEVKCDSMTMLLLIKGTLILAFDAKSEINKLKRWMKFCYAIFKVN